MPELSRRTTRQPGPTRTAGPRRFLVALCTAAVVSLSGLPAAQVGHADPDLTLEEVQERVDELYKAANVAAENYHQATDELGDIERRLSKSQDRVERQEARLKELLSEIGGFAAATYRTGGIDPALQVMLADDPDDYLAQASVADAYARQQADQLAAVAEQRQRLEQDILLADEELARLRAVETVLEQEKKAADELLAEAQRLLDSLKEEERRRLEEQRRAAAEQASRSAERTAEDPPAAGSGEAGSGAGQIALNFALAQVGKPYQWGGNGPDSYDCSGLTKAAWAAAGVSLPRSSHQQIGVGTRVSWDQLQPGDLVFFYSPISHVGLYAGNGQMVHAVKPGVPVSVVSLDGYYRQHFSGATRPRG